MPSVGHDLPDFAAIRARDQAELGLAASGLVDPQMFHGRNLLRQDGLSGSGERRLRDGPVDLVVPGGPDYRAPAVGHHRPGRPALPAIEPRVGGRVRPASSGSAQNAGEGPGTW